jgi:hypothetical protein
MQGANGGYYVAKLDSGEPHTLLAHGGEDAVCLHILLCLGRSDGHVADQHDGIDEAVGAGAGGGADLDRSDRGTAG